MIPYAKHSITEQDIKAVTRVLRTEPLTQGTVVPSFEQAVADFCGSQYAIAVSNGTCALHLACLALGVTSGDWVWTSPNSFVASANSALYCGANIDFIDIDADSYNISVEVLRVKLIKAEQAGCLPKVIIPVHFSGQSCDMGAIKLLADKYDIALIEDAAHALGGEYRHEKIGCCSYSDICLFSFHPAKMITTAEGGMLLTNNAQLAEKIALLRTHGITRDPALMDQAAHGKWYYQQIALGYNYRMSDLQAALGLSQLQRLEQILSMREKVASYYHTHLIDLPLRLPQQNATARSSWHLYVVCLKTEQIASSRKQVFDHLIEAGIGVQIHYIPIHLQPYYKQLGFKEGDFPQCEKYYQQAITLPLFVDISDQELEYIVTTLKQSIIE